MLIIFSSFWHAVNLSNPDATWSVTKSGGFVVVAGVVGAVGLAGVSVPQLGWLDLSTAWMITNLIKSINTI